MRRLNDFLSVTAQPRIAEVIRVDEDDVGFFPDAGAAAHQTQAGQKRYGTRRDCAAPIVFNKSLLD